MTTEVMFHVKHGPEEAKAVLAEGLGALGIKIGDEAADKLVAYFLLLRQKNEVINLISPKQDLRTQVLVHLVDSLTPLLWPQLPSGPLKALDFGSGGGLPAIPLAIARPGWSFTLAEATGKKAAFLGEAAAELGLANVTVANGYLEPGQNPHGACYGLITARAVTDLAGLIAIAGPRLAPGGYFLAFKGPRGEAELPGAAPKLKKHHMALASQLAFKLPFIEAGRRLYIFQKP